MPKGLRRGLWAAMVVLIVGGLLLAIVACGMMFWLAMNMLSGAL